MVLMTDTPNLALPYILAAQAQKHVTHNEAIRALDCLVQLSVASRALTAPPTTPEEGSRYIVAATATGDWATQDAKIAAYQEGAWAFYTPKDGWLAWVTSENVIVVYDGSGWAALPSGGGGVTDHGMLTGLADDDHLQYLTDARGDARYTPIDPVALGINATADATNRLALKSPASLFDNEGNGHQVKVNKNAAADTASVLYQTNYSGRAEMGLSGDDNFHFKVSPDGTTWHEAILIDRSSGKVSCPQGGPTIQVFTASGTWVKPAGCVKIKATVIGPGGDGGSAPATTGSTKATGAGGGPGGWSILYKDVTSVSSIDVTIGAHGGGTTSFDVASATGGGNGGTAGPTSSAGIGGSPGASGVGSGGTINGGGWVGSGGEIGTGASGSSGIGGSSILGGGPAGHLSATQRNGENATVPGAGGEGSYNSGVQSAATGGNGAPGCVIVEEYYA